MIRHGYQQAVGGQPQLLMTLASDDIEFLFPGQNSFAGVRRGKEPLMAWMRRFASLRPAFHIHDVVVSGPPWNMRIGVRFSDEIGEDYHNEGMEYLRVRRGRLQQVQVFCDTERISAWEERHPELVA
jgi:ketosteroid isomerase-like protein